MKSQAWNKILGIGIVLVLLIWGLSQITDLVMQRQGQRQIAVQSVAQSLAGAQTLLGPIVHMACTEEWQTTETKDNKDGKPVSTNSTARREFTLMAPPTSLTVSANSKLEPRSRGLHTTQVFNMQSKLTAQWADLNALKAEREHTGSRLQCGQALMMVAVSDARGIRQVDVKVNGAAQTVRSGTFMPAYPRGVHSVLPASIDLQQPLQADIQLELMGTESFGLVPLGTATTVELQSNWPHPSFNGQFLPSDKTTPNEAGFNASWRVSALASTAQQDVLQRRHLCGVSEDAGSVNSGCIEMLGVTFLDPTDTYVLSNRATKYGLLFIALTFVAVGLFELMRSLRVHPVQYLLVGAAISVFFLLLVSLSEKIPFVWAYVLAASACVLLLTYYASHMLQSWKRGLPFGGGIATLYGLLFVLLQMEKDALVVGALALFLVLALVMMLTRKVDWYAQLQLNTPTTKVPA